MAKKDVLLFFSDLDGTLLPMKPSQLTRFAHLLGCVSKKLNMDVKFSLISGRPANYVLANMDLFDTVLAENQIIDGIGFGAAEQGCEIVHGKKTPFKRTILTGVESRDLIHTIRENVNKSVFSEYFDYEPDLKFSTAFLIKDSIRKTRSVEDVNEYYKLLREYIEFSYGKLVKTNFCGCLEVVPPEASKEKALMWIMDEYSKRYNVKGIVYCGDSENDKSVIEYLSKLAVIKGIKVNIFLPSNAMDSVKSEVVENWKDKFLHLKFNKSIKISQYKYLEGINDLLEEFFWDEQLINRKHMPKKVFSEQTFFEFHKIPEKDRLVKRLFVKGKSKDDFVIDYNLK